MSKFQNYILRIIKARSEQAVGSLYGQDLPVRWDGPFLEAPDIRTDFRERLATILSELLNENLPAPFGVRLFGTGQSQ